MGKIENLKRHQSIIKLFNDGENFTKKEVLDHLIKNDLKVSGRTLDRDFEQIWEHYKFSIKYCRENKVYKVDPEIDKENALRLIGYLVEKELWTSDLLKNRNLISRISFDKSYAENQKHVTLLQEIIIAVSDHKKIKFTHKKFEAEESSEVMMEPHLLKQYRNRWYVHGWVAEKNQLRNYGLERIESLSITEESYKLPDIEEVKKRFVDVVGINNDQELAVERVEIELSPLQARYLDSVPLHPSQNLFEEKGKYICLFDVKINYEFISQLLMMGPNIKVVKPESLRQTIKEKLQTSMTHYCD